MKTTLLRHTTHTAFGRFVAGLLSVAMASAGAPVVLVAAPTAGGAGEPRAAGRTPVARTVAKSAGARRTPSKVAVASLSTTRPPKVAVNHTVPAVRAVPLLPQLSETPSDRELFRARLFEEPLVPVGGGTDASENRALGDTIRGYVSAGNAEDLTPFETYLKANEATPWRASLLLNMGLSYRRLGRFSRAARAWEDAWGLSKGLEDPYGRAVADRAVGELALLRARFAQIPETEKLLAETEGRSVVGSAKEKLSAARENLAVRRADQDSVRPSGPYALASILRHTQPDYRGNHRIEGYRVPQYGTTLTQVANLAGEVGLRMRMAYRTDKAAVIPTPAVAHLELGHYVPLVKADATGTRYLADDPILGGERWMKASVLADETSGYFLIPDGALPEGWREASVADGNNILGRCDVVPNPDQTRPEDCQEGGNADQCEKTDGGGGQSCPGMPRYSFHSLRASLHIVDTPVGYTPARGPAVDFTVTYNQREATQPQIFTYSNLGPRWTFDYVSFIEDTPSDPLMKITLHVRGGGAERYETSDGQTYGPSLLGRSVITRTSSSPIRYDVQRPNGSVDVYAQPESGASATRRVFLTESLDSTGAKLTFTYDEDLRLVAITDALGQVTTIAYERSDDPLKITRVTDPFGRFALFEYDASGALVQITDVVGLASAFTYDGDFVASMTTPYGTTQFQTRDQSGEAVHARMIEAVDPLGGHERLMYSVLTPSQPSSEPAEQVPAGFADENLSLDDTNTYFWDKRTMALYPGDFSKAHVTHWLRDASMSASGVKHSEKKPLENRIWYAYEGNTGLGTVGTMSKPTRTARVLDDGTSQVYHSRYNSKGKTTRSTDPLGRTTLYNYAPNEIDLLEVRQVNGTSTELLATYTYNDKHQQLTSTDASGQTTTYAYTATNQIHTITNAKNETTTYAYNTDGQLTTITRPVAGATTTFEHDGYGRLWRVTNPEGYAVTTEYDALDRPTRTTYPDGTYEETVYDKLDAAKYRDRMGRWTQTFYDALRRPVATRDPAGRTTQKNEWVSCPSGCGGGGAKLSKLIDANGNATTWEYDLQGRVTQETRANGAEYNYTYENTAGGLKQISDPRGNVKTFAYNRDDTLASITYQPGTGVAVTPNVGFTYDPVYRHVATMTDGTGTTSYTYYPIASPPTLGAGRLQSVDGPLDNDTITYSYDELGRADSRQIGGPSRVETQAFDALGRLTQITNPLGNFIYAYDGVTGRPTSVTYPNGQQTTYAYLDNLGDHRLQEIHNKKPGGATLSRFNYTSNPAGNILTWRQQNESNPAQVYEFGYDDTDQLTAAILKSTDPTPATLKRYYYGYDAAGNRTAEQIDDAVTGATYNNMNQLVSQQVGGALIFKGTVTEPATVTVGGKPATVTVDNRFTGSATVPSGTGQVAVAARDMAGNLRTNTYQVTQSGAGKAFSFDASGNMTGDGTRTFQWDAENRLVRVTQGATDLASFVYNSRGIRTAKTAGGVTTTYVLAGASVVEERRSTGGNTQYFQGPRIDNVLGSQDVSGVSYYVRDHLGSIRQKTDTSGQATLTRDYDAWGNLLAGANAGGYAFTGREWDAESGLYYYRARYYDAKAGRFISEDPIGLDGGLNANSYVGNNPIQWRDPSGLMKLPPSPANLPPGWTPDPSHKYPGGERYTGPGGDKLDWHPGQEGEPGWSGEDHWHWIPPGGKKDPEGHRKPGDDIPDIVPPPVTPPAPESPAVEPKCGKNCQKKVALVPILLATGYVVYKLVELWVCPPLVLVTP